MNRTYLGNRLRCMLAVFAIVLSNSFRMSWAVTIDIVPVGDVGNANDPDTGNLYGGVNYAYGIGTYEVTVDQYTAFLNAVAATDTYGLYTTLMATDLNIAGIARSGASGSYTYSVIGSPNHPVTYVSFGDAARFANWLHNGQPTGLQNAGTTEQGAYTLNGANSEVGLSHITRNANARWFVPSESEWYKAAYYQPASMGGDSDDYWFFPMQTNSPPISDQPPGTTPDNTRVGNFYGEDEEANAYNDGYAATGSTFYYGGQNYLTDVGAYSSSPTFYGTFDQGGNVWEWNEAIRDDMFRAVRGGSWYGNANLLQAPNWGSPYANGEFNSLGFRMATLIPEPNTALLGIIVGALVSALRRRTSGR